MEKLGGVKSAGDAAGNWQETIMFTRDSQRDAVEFGYSVRRGQIQFGVTRVVSADDNPNRCQAHQLSARTKIRSPHPQSGLGPRLL